MSIYIDADALLKEWGIELPKERPVKGKPSKEVLAFMEKYKNHPYYFAILSLYFSESAEVVPYTISDGTVKIDLSAIRKKIHGCRLEIYYGKD